MTLAIAARRLLLTPTLKQGGGYGAFAYGAWVGDSRPANSILAIGTNTGRTMQGVASWEEFLSYGRIRSPASYIKAVGGSGVSALAGQITAALALTPKPTVINILSGTNTINNATTTTGLSQSLQDAYVAAWAQIIAGGARPRTVIDLPRQWTTTTLTAAEKRAVWNDFIAWQRVAAPAAGSMVVDLVSALTDPGSADGDPVLSYYYPETPAIHIGPTGAYIVGQALKASTESKFTLPPRYLGISETLDTYNVSTNPTGNLIPNGGLFTGTGGSVQGGNPPTAVNPISTGWIVRNDTGAAHTKYEARVVPRDDGGMGNWLDVQVEAANAFTALVFAQGAFNCAIGDTCFFATDLEILASSGMIQVETILQDRNAAGSVVNAGKYATQFGTPATIGAMQSTFAGRARTDPITAGASFGIWRRGVSIQLGSSGGSVHFRLGAAEMRKVV